MSHNLDLSSWVRKIPEIREGVDILDYAVLTRSQVLESDATLPRETVLIRLDLWRALDDAIPNFEPSFEDIAIINDWFAGRDISNKIRTKLNEHGRTAYCNDFPCADAIFYDAFVYRLLSGLSVERKEGLCRFAAELEGKGYLGAHPYLFFCTFFSSLDDTESALVKTNFGIFRDRFESQYKLTRSTIGDYLRMPNQFASFLEANYGFDFGGYTFVDGTNLEGVHQTGAIVHKLFMNYLN